MTEAAVLDLAWEALLAVIREDNPAADELRRPELGAAYRDGMWIVMAPRYLAGEPEPDHTPRVMIRDADGVVVLASSPGSDA